MSMEPTAAEALDIAYEINKILDCGLDKESLSICIALLETGINPEALAQVIKKLREEAAQANRQANQRHDSAAPSSSGASR
jgi:mitotic-spindle organizing protein 1